MTDGVFSCNCEAEKLFARHMQIPWVEGEYFKRIDLSYLEGGGKGTEKV